MADKITMVLKDRVLQDKLRKLGLKNSQKYSWKETAKKTLAVYREVLYK
jgi:glycosyltransferase involved in cell wall biosynthesis